MYSIQAYLYVQYIGLSICTVYRPIYMNSIYAYLYVQYIGLSICALVLITNLYFVLVFVY